MFVSRLAARLALVSAALVLGGCWPAYDWRQVRPAGGQVEIAFPCKPSAQNRQVQLAGRPLRLALHACAAAGQTWGLAFADLADPLRVPAVLAELGASAAANIAAGAALRAQPVQVAGATPNPGSQRLWLAGKLPDGKAVKMQVAVFTYGSRVFQATALGAELPDEAADTFFQSIRVQP